MNPVQFKQDRPIIKRERGFEMVMQQHHLSLQLDDVTYSWNNPSHEGEKTNIANMGNQSQLGAF